MIAWLLSLVGRSRFDRLRDQRDAARERYLDALKRGDCRDQRSTGDALQAATHALLLAETRR